YYITPEWIATIGRQPGTDGPGSNLRNNALRQSTYPALAINALGDAAVITYKPESLQDHKVAIRAAYGKTYQWDEENGKVRDWMSDQKDADANLYYAAVEGELPIEGMGDNLIIFNVAHMTDFALPIPGSMSLGDDEVVNLGNLTLANIHFENYKAFGTNFNWFASLGYSNGSNNEINPLLSTALQIQSKGYSNGKFNEK
ncbi:outer membrane tyrosine kinase, partial [Campylobacter jejuni]|nr:outer membrane tyrosine kinase [Campylobacter jejuni]